MVLKSFVANGAEERRETFSHRFGGDLFRLINERS